MAKKRRANAKRSAKSKAKLEKSVAQDRVRYLKSVANPKVTFKSKRDAEQFAKTIFKDTGAKYIVDGKTAHLDSITKHNVERSTDFKRIKRDLATQSNKAKGKKARALEQLGRRESFWSWAVGETNE